MAAKPAIPKLAMRGDITRDMLLHLFKVNELFLIIPIFLLFFLKINQTKKFTFRLINLPFFSKNFWHHNTTWGLNIFKSMIIPSNFLNQIMNLLQT